MGKRAVETKEEKMERQLESLENKLDDLIFLQKVQMGELKHLSKEINKVEKLDTRVQQVENTAAFAKGLMAVLTLSVGSVVGYILNHLK